MWLNIITEFTIVSMLIPLSNNMKFLILVTMLFGLFPIQSKGQPSLSNKKTIDSLIAKAFLFNHNLDSAIIYAKPAYTLSKNNKYALGEARSLGIIANYEYRKSNFDTAILQYGKARDIFKKLKRQDEEARMHLGIATIYSNTNQYAKSAKIALSILPYFEKSKDSGGEGKTLNLLAITFARQAQFAKAKTYFFKYNELAKQHTDTIDLGYSYNNIGSVYRDMGKQDSALFHFKIALRVFSSKQFYHGMALANKNIGSIYFDRKHFREALSYARASLEMTTKIGDKRGMCHSNHDIASCYRQLGQISKAKEYYNKALLLADEIDEREIQHNSNFELYEIALENKDYKTALTHFKIAKAVNDSVFSAAKTKSIAELNTKYETEKKEQRIKVLNQESQIQRLEIKEKNTFLMIAIVSLLFLLSSGYFLYNRHKLMARALLQEEIIKQQEIAARAVLDAEERERRRMAGDLHDGVGQLLSAALMSMNGLFQKLNLEGSEAEKAEQSISLVTESYDEMRSISHQMMPNALIKAGLASAVREFLNKLDRDKIVVGLEVVGLNERLDQQIETVIYRVVQETVNNVIKHADATKLNIQLIKDEEGITVVIEDNGKGFDKTKSNLGSGIGLSNIYSRVGFLKGTVEIDSKPNKGTLVHIFIP